MKLSIILPTYVYNEERARLATLSMNCLAKTDTSKLEEKPKLFVLIRPPKLAYNYPDCTPLAQRFDLAWEHQPNIISGTEMTLAYGTKVLFDDPEVDFVTWMGDDALFHPDWLYQLQELIKRNPEAVAWSVYRSAYTAVHQELDILPTGDISVQSICGHGFTIAREEWLRWNIDWQDGYWACGRGDTLDMYHVHGQNAAQGLRVVTPKSYVEHTGRVGVHCLAHIPEWAIDFQGTGE